MDRLTAHKYCSGFTNTHFLTSLIPAQLYYYISYYYRAPSWYKAGCFCQRQLIARMAVTTSSVENSSSMCKNLLIVHFLNLTLCKSFFCQIYIYSQTEEIIKVH
jgi:hypothetical protein